MVELFAQAILEIFVVYPGLIIPWVMARRTKNISELKKDSILKNISFSLIVYFLSALIYSYVYVS